MRIFSRRSAGVVLAAIIGVFAPQVGCGGGGGGSTSAPAAPDPVITSFIAASSTIQKGGSTTLTAVFSNGTGSVTNNVGTPIGAISTGVAKTVTPAATTTYTLTVTNTDGKSTSLSSSVAVVAPNATITLSSASVAYNGSVTASVLDQTGVTYEWAVTGGAITAGDGTRTITVAPAAPATSVAISAKVTNAFAVSATGNASASVTGIPGAAVATITAPASTPANVAFTASVPVQADAFATFAWTVTGGTPATGAERSITVTPGIAGGGSVGLSCVVTPIYSAPAIGTATVLVTLPQPNATVTTSAPFVKQGSTVTASVPDQANSPTYAWTVTGGNPATGTGQSITVTPDAGATLVALSCAVTNSFSVTSTGTANVPVPSAGAAYTWPAYSPSLDYDYTAEIGQVSAPTKGILPDGPTPTGTYVLNPTELAAASDSMITLTDPWWSFRYGKNKNSHVTSAAWIPMLQRYEHDFAYFRNVMAWPPDKRAKRGYFSNVDLWGSGLADGQSDNTAMGGWQGAGTYAGESWPMVILSWYPVSCFDPAFDGIGSDGINYGKSAQQGACIHEGIHAVLADMDGLKEAAWGQEAFNTSLQGWATAKMAIAGGATEAQAYGSMGWLSAPTMIAPFMPIECYSGWLQDGSFGGPSAEGVDQFVGGKKLCTWRNLLGGVQYGEAFGHFMIQCVSPRANFWIWKSCTERVLEGLATKPGGLGDAQTRHLITEYRTRQAFCDFHKMSAAFQKLLDDNWGKSIIGEGKADNMTDLVPGLAPWLAYPYAKTTSDGATYPTLAPDPLTLPGWSGANQIPLMVVPGATQVVLNFLPIGANMRCQLAYKAADDGSIIYSEISESGACALDLTAHAPKNNVVIAVISNTDYVFGAMHSDGLRKNKYDYRLQLLEGVSGAASTTEKWYSK